MANEKNGRFLLILILVLILGYSANEARAHTEGKMQLASAPAGPFKMTTWTSPDPAEVGELHVATAVVNAEDASPVLGADVSVQLTPNSGGDVLSAPATNEDATNKFLYEAVFEVKDAGAYRVTIAAIGPDGASGEASFDLDVISAGGFDPLLLIPVILALAAVGLLWASRRRPPSGQPATHVPNTVAD